MKEISSKLKVRNVLRIALYIRVSTQDQADEGYSIGEQEERLRNYCKAMSWEISKVYIDPGYSGSNTDRPGLQSLIKDVENGIIDKVVVYKLDRLSRSQLDTLYLIEKVFLANGADFVSMTENFDTATPFGRAMIGILAVFAQLERDKIKERMIMGQEARAKEGKWHGGSTQPVGYDYNPDDDLLHVNEYEAMQIRELYDLFLKGTPIRTIEKEFLKKGYRHKHGVWDGKTMRRVMANKTNIGYIKHNENWYKGLHESIVDDETFNKANQLLKARAEAYKASGIKPGAQTSYLGGLLYCKKCGAKYSKVHGRKHVDGSWSFYYSCYSRAKKIKRMIKDPNCKNKNYRMELLDEIVFNEIRKLATDPNYIHDIKAEKLKNTDTAEKIRLLNKEIEKLDDQISRFMDLYGIGKFTIEQVSSKVDPLNEDKAKLEKELESLTGTEELNIEETLELVESFGDILDRGDFNEIRLTVESLIHYIEINDDEIRIHWKFA